MPNAIMYQEDAFVVLETNQPEQILTGEELQEKLRGVLVTLQDDLPEDLRSFTTVDAQVQYLMDTVCELNVGPGQFLQWYVIRLEK